MRTPLTRFIAQPLKDFLFPPLCLSCRGRLSSAEEFLCAQCARSLVRVNGSDFTMHVLKERFRGSDAISSFFPLYYFEEHGVLQHVIHALKYEEMTAIGRAYGGSIGARLLAISDYADADIIIPVPLHPQKERERGYNQSEWICKGIAGAMGLPVDAGAVRRTKNTRTQTKLSAAERLENMNGAFVVDERPETRVRDKKIILVDDVITTGATMHSCASALRGAGAKCIVCASIAVAKLNAGQGPPLRS